MQKKSSQNLRTPQTAPIRAVPVVSATPSAERSKKRRTSAMVRDDEGAEVEYVTQKFSGLGAPAETEDSEISEIEHGARKSKRKRELKTKDADAMLKLAIFNRINDMAAPATPKMSTTPLPGGEWAIPERDRPVLSMFNPLNQFKFFVKKDIIIEYFLTGAVFFCSIYGIKDLHVDGDKKQLIKGILRAITRNGVWTKNDPSWETFKLTTEQHLPGGKKLSNPYIILAFKEYDDPRAEHFRENMVLVNRDEKRTYIFTPAESRNDEKTLHYRVDGQDENADDAFFMSKMEKVIPGMRNLGSMVISQPGRLTKHQIVIEMVNVKAMEAALRSDKVKSFVVDGVRFNMGACFCSNCNSSFHTSDKCPLQRHDLPRTMPTMAKKDEDSEMEGVAGPSITVTKSKGVREGSSNQPKSGSKKRSADQVESEDEEL